MKLTKEQASTLVDLANLTESDLERALFELQVEMATQPGALEDFFRALSDHAGDVRSMLSLTHEPVDFETFVRSPEFLNMAIIDSTEEDVEQGVWRKVFTAAQAVAEGNFSECLFMGAIGIGKTTAAQMVNAYHLYRLSCERFPQLKLGQMPNAEIVYVCMNVTDHLARDVTFARLRSFLDGIKYFDDHFARDKTAKNVLNYPNHIRVEYGAANAEKFMGKNVIGGIADELNFMKIVENSKKARGGADTTYNQAQEIYTKMVRRIKSRFDTDTALPGTMSLVSSKSYPNDFTEVRKREAEAAKDGMTYVFDFAQWDVKPNPAFKRGTPFYVEIGEGRHGSRIVDRFGDLRADCNYVEVPAYFRSDFEKDLEGSLRDFAGLATDTLDAFFYDKNRIWSMADYFDQEGFMTPFTSPQMRFGQGFPDVDPEYVVPNPTRPRACHVDLSLSRDSCGIAIGHVFKVSSYSSRNNETGVRQVEEVPHIAYDIILEIKPPKRGQIEFAEIRHLIYMIVEELNIPVKWITYDGFQSVDSRQILRRKGFKTDHVSVENLDIYTSLRTAIFTHGRIAAPEHELAFTEISQLEANYEDGTIDHPPEGSKDCADAMAGVFAMLSKVNSSWSEHLREDVEETDTEGKRKSKRPSSGRPKR